MARKPTVTDPPTEWYTKRTFDEVAKIVTRVHHEVVPIAVIHGIKERKRPSHRSFQRYPGRESF